MKAEKPLLIVSCDGHTGAPPYAYADYIESKYRDDLKLAQVESDHWGSLSVTSRGASQATLDAIDDRNAIRTDGELGAWDMQRRIKELDAEGIACEFLLSGHQLALLPFFHVSNNVYSAELRMAGTRAYHRWLADCMKDAGGRLVGVGEPGTCLDMDDTVKELNWIAKNGFVSVLMPGNVGDPNLPPLTDKYYEPFWQACEDPGLALNLHAGWSLPQGIFQNFIGQQREMMGGELDAQKIEQMSGSPLALIMAPRRAMWQLMVAGVFDRHPNLRLAMTEIRADWLPPTITHLDKLYAEGKTPMKKSPSEYFAANCAMVPSSPRRVEIEMRDKIGISNLMFGADYPHPEGTWPNTKDWFRAAFRGVPEQEVRKIVGENAIDFFGLDREYLTKIADKIGPLPSDVLGGHSVPDDKIAHFTKRAGFGNPAVYVDTDDIDEEFQQDLVAVR